MLFYFYCELSVEVELNMTSKIFKPVCLAIILALVLSLVTVVMPVAAKMKVGDNEVEFTASPTEGLAPLTVQFTDQSVAGAGYVIESWAWDFGDGSASNAQNPSHTYTDMGTYTVNLTVTFITDGPAAEITETKDNYINVGGVADFTASPTMGQAPLTVQFRDQSTGNPKSWSWSFGDGEGSSSRYPSHTYQNAGTYTVSLTISGSATATKTMTSYIVVEEAAGTPDLVVRNLYISAEYAQPRQEIQITADVANEGGSWGSDTVDLLINGYCEQSVGVGVAPGTSQPISYTAYKVTPGEYLVQVGEATATFYVMEEPVEEGDRTEGRSIPLGTGGTIAIIVVAVILVVGIVVVFLLARPT
jgi:PKD repeat protein